MASWLAIVISLLAFGFSFYQYWRSSLSPYSLVVMPPAITQANDELPSLIIHLAMANVGGHEAVLTDMVIRGISKGKAVPITLRPQKLLDNRAKYSSLPLSDDRLYSVFLPVLIRHDESVNLDIYCTPLAIDSLTFDFWINGEEKPAVFTLGYADYGDKFKGGHFLIPKNGFAPRWYRDVKPVRIQPAIWGI
jgi:hypothetical protein